MQVRPSSAAPGQWRNPLQLQLLWRLVLAADSFSWVQKCRVALGHSGPGARVGTIGISEQTSRTDLGPLNPSPGPIESRIALPTSLGWTEPQMRALMPPSILSQRLTASHARNSQPLRFGVLFRPLGVLAPSQGSHMPGRRSQLGCWGRGESRAVNGSDVQRTASGGGRRGHAMHTRPLAATTVRSLRLARRPLVTIRCRQGGHAPVTNPRVAPKRSETIGRSHLRPSGPGARRSSLWTPRPLAHFPPCPKQRGMTAGGEQGSSDRWYPFGISLLLDVPDGAPSRHPAA